MMSTFRKKHPKGKHWEDLKDINTWEDIIKLINYQNTFYWEARGPTDQKTRRRREGIAMILLGGGSAWGIAYTLNNNWDDGM